MAVLALLVLAVAPGIFILWYIYAKDKYEHEPTGLILATFFIGVGVAVPAGLLELGLEALIGVPMTGNIVGAFIGSFFIVAPIEEIAKFLSVRIKAYRSPAFNEVMDGIVYSVSGALGFATIENIFYVLEYGFATGVFRAVFSVPLHALCGAILGYYLGMKKIEREPKRYFLTAGLLIVIFFHGIYDFVLFSETFLGFFIIPIIIVLYIIYKRRLFDALKDSPFRGGRDEALFAVVRRRRTPGGLIKISLGIIMLVFSAVMIAGWVIAFSQGQSFSREQYGYIVFLILAPLGAGLLLLFIARKNVVVR